MSDPHLSTLCRTCLAAPPKYVCPRCGARNCSLPCVKKHKARASCSGIRDSTKYVPASDVRTEKVFHHDYNFLRRIETKQQLAERELFEKRTLFGADQLHPKNEDKLYEEVWNGEELHHVRLEPRERLGQDGSDRIEGFDKHVRRRIRMLNIEVRTMPKGMTRQQENKTGWHRKSLSVNWQVEWMLFYAERPDEPVRILHKVIEKTPLNYGLAASLGWQKAHNRKRGQEEAELSDEDGEPPGKKHKHRKRKEQTESVSFAQDWANSTWPESECTLQSCHNARWGQNTKSSSTPKVPEDGAYEFAKWQFFLKKDGNPKSLIPLSPTESLASALTGRTIIEFPTIYALAPSLSLPDGYVLGSAERQAPKILEVRDEGDEAAPSHQQRLGRENVQALEQRHSSQRHTRGARGNSRRGGPGTGGGGRGRGRYDMGSRQAPRRRPRDDAQPETTIDGSADEGEINSDGEVLDALKEVSSLIGSFPDQSFANGEYGMTQGGVPKSVRGLVDYGSDSE